MSGAASATGKKNEVEIKALTEPVKVRIEVSGEIAKGDFAGDTDTIRKDNVAISRINNDGELDNFLFSGEITDFDVIKGDVEVTLNGEKVDPDTLGKEPLDDEIVLKALTEPVKVRIEVSGEIAKGDFAGDTDTIRKDNVAISRINNDGELDNFLFSGRITDFDVIKGDVKVTLNGEEVDLGELGQRTITLRAEGPEVTYNFTVSGSLEAGPAADINNGDEITDQTATGFVIGNGFDDYLFTGDITQFETSSDELTVLVDGEGVDPDNVV